MRAPVIEIDILGQDLLQMALIEDEHWFRDWVLTDLNHRRAKIQNAGHYAAGEASERGKP
jgi:hypothetical protein